MKLSTNKNPVTNRMINPNFNRMINPNFNRMINPNFNRMINPTFNRMINPIFNRMINPNFNRMINPTFNRMINPNFNRIVNPNFNLLFSGFFSFNFSLIPIEFIVVSNTNILFFNQDNVNTRIGIKHQNNGYVLFDLNMQFIGHLESNSQNGYNEFDKNNNWTKFIA